MNVSIIIPVLNEADRIGRAIDLAWLAGANEVIVVDGGSDDATCQKASASRCVLLNSPIGRASQQNAGAQIASGEVLLFLHADNWLAGGAVQQVRDLMHDTEFQYGAFRQSIEAPGMRYRWLEWGNGWRVRWRGVPYGDQGIFVRRDTFLAAGGFPEVPLMEDLLLMRNLRRRSWPRLLAGPIHVDPRRWQRHGVVRQTLRNWWLVRSHDRGVPLERLATHYRRHDRSADSEHSPGRDDGNLQCRSRVLPVVYERGGRILGVVAASGRLPPFVGNNAILVRSSSCPS